MPTQPSTDATRYRVKFVIDDVYLGCVVEKHCDCCQAWQQVQALWNIDVMDDSPEYDAVTLDKWLTPEQARALPGYLAEVAKELLREAEAEAEAQDDHSAQSASAAPEAAV